MGGKRKKKRKFSTFSLPFFLCSSLPFFLCSQFRNARRKDNAKEQRPRGKRFQLSYNRLLVSPPPNSCPKIVVLRRARSWNNLVRRVLPRVADTNPTLASCSLVRVYRGRESSLTSPGATSFLHDLNVDTYTYIYASACTVGDFEAKLRLPSCFSRPRYRTSPTKRF